MKEIVIGMISVKMVWLVDQIIAWLLSILTLKLTAVLNVILQVVEKLDSAIVTLVLKMKEIVMLMMSVKMVLNVDQTTVHPHLDLTQKLIVAINQLN